MRQAEAVRYTVRFPEPRTHYLTVEAAIPVDAPEVEVFMPVWTPGSYLIREFSRHVEAVAATGERGQPLSVSKSRKNRWRIETLGAREIRVDYRVYCREMSVRTNWVEDSFALLNGAATFLTLPAASHLTCEVRLELPARWRTSATGLTEIAPNHYAAPNYDTLVDSPIVAGNPAVYRFLVDGVPHSLVNIGEDGVWDGKRSAADLERIVHRFNEMWGSLPCDRYVFLNLITEGGGGLEHTNSVCIMASRWAARTRRGYLNWLSLAAHEYFHIWNVKRLRPRELGPFDYEAENHTRSLWVAEGITEYYAPLTVRRAGLSSRAEYLESLSGLIEGVQSTPGRLVCSLEQASWDAWIKLYRPDENTPNTSISYYTKGALVGWLLDTRIRRATRGDRTLDDLMRLAYARYSGAAGFTPEEFKALAEEVAGTSLRDFFRGTVESTGELDYSEALEWFGLGFNQPGGDPQAAKAWTGAETKNDGGRLVVAKIPRGTPAFDSGLNVEDEILATGEFRVRADQWGQRLECYRPGERISLLVARREKLIRIDLTLGEEPGRRWQLEVRPHATGEQRARIDAWLGK
jgi:predicted metalloprotease with PDZ domain